MFVGDFWTIGRDVETGVRPTSLGAGGPPELQRRQWRLARYVVDITTYREQSCPTSTPPIPEPTLTALADAIRRIAFPCRAAKSSSVTEGRVRLLLH